MGENACEYIMPIYYVNHNWGKYVNEQFQYNFKTIMLSCR